MVAPSIGGPGALTELGEPLSCSVTREHRPSSGSRLRADFQPAFSPSDSWSYMAAHSDHSQKLGRRVSLLWKKGGR